MFIICNYLDVCNKRNLPDGFLVEECGDYDESLADYAIVCQNYREGNILAWAEANMGDKYQMFKKQFAINPTKAMIFIRLKGEIKSYTEDLVMQSGGLEEFKKLYCKPLGNNVQTLELNDVSASEQVLPTTDSEEETEPGVVEDQTEIVEDPYAYENDSENENESEGQTEDSEVYSAREEKENTQSKVIKYCNEMCIYNSDGSFKGFTEGQIVSMLSHLKELDKRIAMDTLNPEYILTEDELRNAAPFLDTIAPSVFKAFIAYLVLNASSETDRIRSSVMLDNLCSFLNSMN